MVHFPWVWKSGYFGRKKFLDSDWSCKVRFVWKKNDWMMDKKNEDQAVLALYGSTLELALLRRSMTQSTRCSGPKLRVSSQFLSNFPKNAT
jgi:hypothetical protein